MLRCIVGTVRSRDPLLTGLPRDSIRVQKWCRFRGGRFRGGMSSTLAFVLTMGAASALVLATVIIHDDHP